MTTRERMEAVKVFVYDTCCKGRKMRTPGADGTIDKVCYEEPRVYVGYYPIKQETQEVPRCAIPSILIMMAPGHAYMDQEERLDRYGGIKRSEDLGQVLALQLLFTCYEPENRGVDFGVSGRISDLDEYTEEGFYQLTGWMDELQSALMGAESIPGSDLMVWKNSVQPSPVLENGYLIDKRPIYRGVVNCKFRCYVNRALNENLRNLLD